MEQTQLHNSVLELVAQAHYHLNNEGTAFPVSKCRSDLYEVIYGASCASIPSKVSEAHTALKGDSPNVERADSLLRDVLSGTSYDPTDPNSNHPNAGETDGE